MTEIWRSVDPLALHWRTWGEEHVVYDDGSGDTHLLDAEAAAVLLRLTRGPASTDELVTELARELEIEPNQALTSNITITLAMFKRLGLIEPDIS